MKEYLQSFLCLHKELLKVMFGFFLLGFFFFPILDSVFGSGEQTFTYIEVLVSSFIIVWCETVAEQRMKGDKP